VASHLGNSLDCKSNHHTAEICLLRGKMQIMLSLSTSFTIIYTKQPSGEKSMAPKSQNEKF